jgi:hypothetical protein
MAYLLDMTVGVLSDPPNLHIDLPLPFVYYSEPPLSCTKYISSSPSQCYILVRRATRSVCRIGHSYPTAQIALTVRDQWHYQSYAFITRQLVALAVPLIPSQEATTNGLGSVEDCRTRASRPPQTYCRYIALTMISVL